MQVDISKMMEKDNNVYKWNSADTENYKHLINKFITDDFNIAVPVGDSECTCSWAPDASETFVDLYGDIIPISIPFEGTITIYVYSRYSSKEDLHAWFHTLLKNLESQGIYFDYAHSRTMWKFLDDLSNEIIVNNNGYEYTINLCNQTRKALIYDED